MSGTLSVARAVAKRSINHALKNPALLVPAIVFPLVFLIGFAGGLSAIDDVPGFKFDSGYTAFQFVFVFLQSAAFGGVFTGFGIAADWESGFARRILLAAPHRTGILLGYALAAMVRYTTTAIVITVAALVAGMRVGGDGVDLVGLVLLGFMLNVAATMWGAGVSLRAKSLQAGPLMQIPIFLSLFLAPVYVPIDLLQGWINGVASYNPLTALLTAGRGFISGHPDKVAIAFFCGAGLIAFFSVWALRGLRRVERGL